MAKAVPLPEFYYDDLCTVGWWFFDNTFALGHFDDILLYNNATDGSLLYVYGINAVGDSTNGFIAYSLQGNTGTLKASGSRVRFTQATPFGQVFVNTVTVPNTPPSPDPGPPAGSQFISTLAVGVNAPVAVYLANYPLFVVDPGYSLLFHPQSQVADWSFGFWYLVASPS